MLALRQAQIRRIDAAAYRIPTDAPEADGTFEWDATILVVVAVYDSGGFTSYDDDQMRRQLGGWVQADGCQAVKIKIGARPGDLSVSGHGLAFKTADAERFKLAGDLP